MGRLVADPELRKTGNDISVTTFTIAVDHDRRNSDGERGVDFIDIVAWRHTAEFVCSYFSKGRMIAVTGRLQIRSYTDKEGVRRKAAEIIADDVYFADSKRDSQQSGMISNQRGGTGYGGGYGSGGFEANDFEAMEPGEFMELHDDGPLPF